MASTEDIEGCDPEELLAVFLSEPDLSDIHTDTTTLVLRRGATAADASVRAAVASHPRTPPDVLDHLSHDDDPAVVTACAHRPDLPATAIDDLVRSFNSDVIATLAGNPAAPAVAVATRILALRPRPETLAAARPEVLRHLARSRKAWTIRLVAEHPNTPPDVLEHLATRDHPETRGRVAMNPSLPDALAAQLAVDSHATVRAVVAVHTRSHGALLILSHDPDLAIRGHATYRLANYDRQGSSRPALGPDRDRGITSWHVLPMPVYRPHSKAAVERAFAGASGPRRTR